MIDMTRVVVLVGATRTGTATWKKIRARELRAARRAGITHCRYCKVPLNYDVSLKPNSAEVDHVVAHSVSGDNGVYQVICRRCNQSKGARHAPSRKIIYQQMPLQTSRKW